MVHTSLLVLHISCAAVALLAGFAAMAFRKGSNWHGATGTVFFVSMIGMTASAAPMAVFLKPNRLNVVVSLLTLYLVVTAWRAAKQRLARTSSIDWLAMLFVLAVSLTGLTAGFQAAAAPRGTKDGMPAAIYFVFGTIALLCSVTDMRMLARGGVEGSQRIVRHLWRMCLALLIATLSFYPGQAKLFPMWLRETRLLLVPMVLVIGSMLLWRVRMSRRRAARHQVITAARGDAIVSTLDGARAPAM
jgi:hypothetical protein